MHAGLEWKINLCTTIQNLKYNLKFKKNAYFL